MEQKIKVGLLPNYYLNEDGTFNKEEAIKLSGKIAGVCYDQEGFEHLLNEDEAKTQRRVDRTLNNGHHSVYDHITINFNLKNIPKIIAMVLNNEHQYTTSEKSARYTPIVRTEGSIITKDEELLYNKWLEILKVKIKEKYGDFYNDIKIKKLAQENARYMVTVFMPTEMIYSTTLRQINYIAGWMKDYIANVNENDAFSKKCALYMQDFIKELERVNVLEPALMSNEKNRGLSLFGNKLEQKDEYFGDVYGTLYKGSFAQVAQAHRHRTLNYQIEILDKKEYFVPPILLDNQVLVNEWLNDIKSVANIYPQGEMVNIYESGTYDNFILKCKERLCTEAQLEIMLQTRETLLKYKDALEKTKHYKASDIIKYTHGARCTFSDFTCLADCKFKEGKTLNRKI